MLRKDARYELAESLDRAERQRMYDEHLVALSKKSRELFHKLLDETPAVTLTARWKDVKDVIKEDPRYVKFVGRVNADEVRVRAVGCVGFFYFLKLFCIASLKTTDQYTQSTSMGMK